MKFLKPGKVAIILKGKYAGKKVVILKNVDDGTKDHPYGHCIVAGVAKAPLAVTKYMSQKKVESRSRVKSFIKVVNYSHIMPTRYAVEFDFKKIASAETVADPTKRRVATKLIRKTFQERYMTGKNKWFFTKLRF